MRPRPIIAMLLVAVVLRAASARAAEPELVFPHEPSPIRLQLQVQVDQQPADVAWTAFLDQWFAFFDRDANGNLSDTELARVLPLPLTHQRQVALDVKQLDANGDGQGSLAEMKAYYRQSGFAPVVTELLGPSDEIVRVSDVLFASLDSDSNAVLSRSELEQAPALLNRLDENEDEALTMSEVLSGTLRTQGRLEPPATTSQIAEQPAGSPPVILNVALGRERTSTVAPPTELKGQVETLSAVPADPMRLRLGKNFCAVILEEASKEKSFKSVRAFYTAQFKATFGAQGAVTKVQLAQDATLALIAELFDVAERNGDGMLNLEELTAFLLLIQQGVSGQTTATLHSHGRSLFEILDNDHDGRLVLRELTGAARFLTVNQMPTGVTREQVPIQFQLHLEQGSPGATFATIPLPIRAKRPAAAAPTAEGKSVRWLQLLDRNGDGLLSPLEFPGKQDQFRQFDTDGDGLITVEEAAQVPAATSK